MYSPVETSQVLMPAVSYVLVPETQLVPQVSYAAEVPEVLPAVTLPTQVSQIMVPQVQPTVSMVPQVSQLAVSQVAPVVPTVSMAPQVSTLAVSQVAPVAPTVSMAPPQPVPVPPPMSKPLLPSPPYEAFVPPTPVPKSVTDDAPPQLYQFYQAVPVPPPAPAPAPAPAPVTTASFVNVPMTTSVNVPVTTSVAVPVTTSLNVTNPYSTLTAPAPIAPTTSLLLDAPQYQTLTTGSYM